MTDYDVAKKASDETLRLQTARRDFAQLQKDEEKYLGEREARAIEKLAKIQTQIDSSTSLFGSIVDRVGKQIGEYRTRFESFVNRFTILLKRSDDIIKSVGLLRSKTDKLKEFLDKKLIDLSGFEGRLSAWEHELVGREELVKELHKEANEKLAEAEQLADWANSGQRYTIKPKK